MGFQGSVESFSLADVFQNLAMNQQTGTLHVFSKDGTERFIFFNSGQVKFLSHGKDHVLVRSDTLLGRGVAEHADIKRAEEQAGDSDKSLVTCLIELNLLDEKKASDVVSLHIEEEIYELFHWEKANFEFKEDPADPALFRGQMDGRARELPVSHLIMEAARRVDEWDRLQKSIPSFKDIYICDKDVREAIEAGALELDPIERRVIALIDGKRDVDDLIEDAKLFRFEILFALAGFLQSNLVRPSRIEELQKAAEELSGPKAKARKCKIYERMLSMGAESPAIRKQLAETLIELNEGERATIHFNVLADAEFNAGNTDNAVNYYRQILQVHPQHLGSRERLGQIYTQRGQTREAVVQYQALVQAYRFNKQWNEAKDAAQKALNLDSSHLEIHKDFVQLLLDAGDKKAAAKACETLGDHYAAKNDVQNSVESYRRAMALDPGLTYLKKKLANAMLTREDRRVRNKRTLVVAGVIIALLAVAGLLTLYELNHLRKWRVLDAKVELIQQEASTQRENENFKMAVEKFEEGLVEMNKSKLQNAWSPVLGINKKANDRINTLKNLRDETNEDFLTARDGGAQNSQKALDAGIAAQRKDDLYNAIKHFKTVLENEFASKETKDQASEMLKAVQARKKEFETNLALIEKNDPSLFESVEEELKLKTEFLQKFQNVFPQIPNMSERRDKISLPLEIKPNIDGIKVSLDGKLLGVLNKPGDVYRYPCSGSDHTFKFVKEGYKGVVQSTHGIGASLVLNLERKALVDREISHSLSGNGVYHDGSIWIGTATGGLLEIDPKTLDLKWEFEFPGISGIDKEVYGDIVPVTWNGKKRILYATKSGHGVVAEPGSKSPIRLIPGLEKPLTGPAAIKNFRHNTFFIFPGGNRLRVVEAERAFPLWSRGWSQELPNDITTQPTVSEDGSLIIVGCRDGNVYGIDVRDGRKVRTWQGHKAAITGRPVQLGPYIIAGAQNGRLFFFDLKKGGPPLDNVELGGEISSAPINTRTHFFVGTTARDGLYSILIRELAVNMRISGPQIQGGVSTSPSKKGDNFIFYGTEFGRFYSLKADGDQWVPWWNFTSRGRSRIVCSPIVVGEKVYFLCADGSIYGFGIK